MHIRLLSLLFLSLALVGCSTIKNSSTFRNRTYDYTRQDVVNLQPLQTPSDLTTPAFAPTFTIPAGQDNYPPSGLPNLTPPGYSDQVPIPPAPPKKSNS